MNRMRIARKVLLVAMVGLMLVAFTVPSAMATTGADREEHPGAQVDLKIDDKVIFLRITLPTGDHIVREINKR